MSPYTDFQHLHRHLRMGIRGAQTPERPTRFDSRPTVTQCLCTSNNHSFTHPSGELPANNDEEIQSAQCSIEQPFVHVQGIPKGAPQSRHYAPPIPPSRRQPAHVGNRGEGGQRKRKTCTSRPRHSPNRAAPNTDRRQGLACDKEGSAHNHPVQRIRPGAYLTTSSRPNRHTITQGKLSHKQTDTGRRIVKKPN